MQDQNQMKPNESGAEVRCPKCHRAIHFGEWECPNCGHKITFQPTTPEPASEAVGGKEAPDTYGMPRQDLRDLVASLHVELIDTKGKLVLEESAYGTCLARAQDAEAERASLQAQVEQLKRERDRTRAGFEWLDQRQEIAELFKEKEHWKAEVSEATADLAAARRGLAEAAEEVSEEKAVALAMTIQRDQLRADVLRLEKERTQLIEDECETDKAVRNLARPILGDAFVDGQGYVTPLEEIVSALLKRLGQIKELAEAIRRLYPQTNTMRVAREIAELCK